MRWTLFILFTILGLTLTIYYKKITEMIGMKIGWAEKYLGPGGTYYAYFIFGILSFVLGLLVLTGVIDLAWLGWAPQQP
jgi:hypothetical protein